MLSKQTQLSQSASALGASLVGFGIGSLWGSGVGRYSILILIVGAVIHVYGMYLMQMKDQSPRTLGIAKALWISAWICLIILAAIVIYLLV